MILRPENSHAIIKLFILKPKDATGWIICHFPIELALSSATKHLFFAPKHFSYTFLLRYASSIRTAPWVRKHVWSCDVLSSKTISRKNRIECVFLSVWYSRFKLQWLSACSKRMTQARSLAFDFKVRGFKHRQKKKRTTLS